MARDLVAMEYIRQHPGCARPETWQEFLQRIAEGIASGELTADGDVGELDLCVIYCVGRTITEKILEELEIPEDVRVVALTTGEVLGRILQWCGLETLTRVVKGRRPDELAAVMAANARPRVHRTDEAGTMTACGIIWRPAEGDDHE